MRKSQLEPVAGSEALYMLDSVTEHTENLLISSGENTPKSTARIYSRGGAREDGMAAATQESKCVGRRRLSRGHGHVCSLRGVVVPALRGLRHLPVRA